MKYYHNLYASESLQFKKKIIIDDLKKEKLYINLYIIVLTKNERNHLEFYDSALLRQKVFRKEDLFVVGIANGYSGAVEVVEQIVQDVCENTNSTDIRNYIINSQQEFEERNK